jgi:hypothetical protein
MNLVPKPIAVRTVEFAEEMILMICGESPGTEVPKGNQTSAATL